MKNRRQGSALLLTLILGAVLLLGLAALVSTALNENRGSIRAAVNSSAFFLAEAGIDRTAPIVLADSFESDDSGWETTAAGVYKRTFSADSESLGRMSGNYRVVVQKNGTFYTLSSRGQVENAGAGVTSERAVQVVYERTTKGTPGLAGGCLAENTFVGASTKSSTISTDQVGPTFDSYKSDGNIAPSSTNRFNNCLVGTESSENGALNLGNGSYYCQVGTGSSAASPTPTVGYATNASPPYNILATLDNPEDTKKEPVEYEPELVRHDVDFDIVPVVPPDAPAKDGWIHVLPKDGEGQWNSAGKIAEYQPKKNAGTPSFSVSGTTATAGASNTDKVYIATQTLEGISQIDVSGEVIIVVLDVINASNGLKINYRTPDAKLTIYAANNVSGVITSTQQMGSAAPVANWEASRLTLGMLPGNHKINMESLEPTAINAHVSTAVKKPEPGGTIIMNFDDRSTFVGSINAPYSDAQLSSAGQKGKLSDYCGSLLAKTISITGTNGFAFHYDEKLGSASDKTPVLVLDSWRQMLPSDPIFD